MLIARTREQDRWAAKDKYMSRETQRHEITKKRVLYQLPGMDHVTIRRDVEYLVTNESTLALDNLLPA